MRILVVGPGKMKYMPYVNFYLDNIDRSEHEIHVAYWNRDEKDEDLSAFEDLILHEYRKYMVNDASLFVKLRLYYGFRKFCIKLIQRYNYDFVIVLHSIPGVILYDKLIKKYHGKYILDYRDSTYEPKVRLFQKTVANIIRHSKVTFTSSDGFRIYFPTECKSKVYTSHNLLEDSLKHRVYDKNSSERIRIAFWGFIRNIELNEKIISSLGNDSRFELHYYGREQSEALHLKEFTARHGYENVFFHGEYKPIDRYEFVKNTDLIHNLYYDENMMKAMANKYYDGLIFRIPQVCMTGSQMAIMCESAQVGIALDPRVENLGDKLYSYYHKFDKNIFDNNCDNELTRILQEYNDGVNVISELFKN